MKYIPLATLLITAPLLSQDAQKVEDQSAASTQQLEESSGTWTAERLPMQRAAGISSTTEEEVSKVTLTLERLPMQKAAGISSKEEESGQSWTAEQLPMQRAAGVIQNDFVELPKVGEDSVSDHDSSDSNYTAERLPMQRAAGLGQVEQESEGYTAEQLPMQKAAGVSSNEEESGQGWTAEQLPMQRAAGIGQVEQESVSYTAEKLPMQRAAGISSTQSNSAEQLPLPNEADVESHDAWSAEQLPMQKAIGVQPTQSSDEGSSGSKGGVQLYPFESPAEKLARLRAERLGRRAAEQAVRNFADAIAVQVSPDKVEIQALADALKPIGFEEFADELDRTEPTLIIDYWFPRLWTRVLDQQLARSVEGLEATAGARELFRDVRQLLQEREAVTRDNETHQRLNDLLNDAEVAGTDSQAFQNFQVEWTKVRMQRAIGLARQDRERSGLVSPTVRQRLNQLRGELGAIRASNR